MDTDFLLSVVFVKQGMSEHICCHLLFLSGLIVALCVCLHQTLIESTSGMLLLIACLCSMVFCSADITRGVEGSLIRVSTDHEQAVIVENLLHECYLVPMLQRTGIHEVS